MSDRTRRALAILFPLTFALHVAEEYAGGFPKFMEHVSGRVVDPHLFLWVNGIYGLLMVAAVVLERVHPACRWVLPSLATVVLFNSLTHLGGTILARAYSPGLASALLLWVPLGSWALRASWAGLPRRSFWIGVTTGACVMALAGILALPLSRPA